jgi:hypothetical protein
LAPLHIDLDILGHLQLDSIDLFAMNRVIAMLTQQFRLETRLILLHTPVGLAMGSGHKPLTTAGQYSQSQKK